MNAKLQPPITASRHSGEPHAPAENGRPGFWQRRLILPIRNQLTQGVSPNALTVASVAGILCGLFPILATTTLLTTLVGWSLRLNQPVMQTINWFIFPLQIALIPVYIRGGEFLFGAEPIPFSIPQLLEIFAKSPVGFFAEFWMTLVHCIVAWLATAPLLGVLLYLGLRPAFRRAARLWRVAAPPSPSAS